MHTHAVDGMGQSEQTVTARYGEEGQFRLDVLRRLQNFAFMIETEQ